MTLLTLNNLLLSLIIIIIIIKSLLTLNNSPNSNNSLIFYKTFINLINQSLRIYTTIGKDTEHVRSELIFSFIALL